METWSVKIEEDLKAKIQDIARQDFNNNQDFMQTLIYLYEMNELKQSDSVLSSEIEEIQKLTNRMVNLFIHSNDKTATLLEERDKFLREEMLSKETTIKMIQEKLREHELKYNNIADINDTLTESNQEYIKEIEELNKSKETIISLVNEYKEKNDTLTGLLQEYKADREENKILKSSHEDLNLKLHHLQLEDANKAKELEVAAEKMTDVLEKHKELMQEIQMKQADELDRMRKNAEVETNMTILKLQQEHQDKITTLNERHSKELETIHDKNVAAIESYQVKYKELLEQLETKQEVIRNLELEHTAMKKEQSSKKQGNKSASK